METIKFALPESMKAFVQKRVAEGNFSSVREYVLALIRADHQRQHEERIEELLLEGLASGEPIVVDAAYWRAKKEKLAVLPETDPVILVGRVVVHPAADQDLDEQALYYLERGATKTALRWYDQVAPTFELLAGQPEMRPQTAREALRGIRSWAISGFDRHDVFYRPLENGIEVVRVLRGAQDIDAMLGDL